MRKKTRIFTLIASLILFQSIFTVDVFATNGAELEEIQKERKEIEKNLSVQEQRINELYDELQALNEEVIRLDELLSEKQARVDEITYDIEVTIEEISTLQEEIEELKLSIEQRFDILKDRAASYQKSGGLVNYIEVLFGAKSFGDFISRLTAVNQIMDSDTSLMEELESDMELVESHQMTRMEKLDELNAMHAEQEEKLVSIEKEKREQEKAQEAVEAKQQELIAYVEELETEDSQLKSMEEKVLADIAEAAKKEREEREKRRLAAIEKQKAEEAKKEKQNGSKLVQVAKFEQKTSNAKSDSSKRSSNESAKNVKKEEKAESKSFTVTATAYTADCKGCSGVTSTGINLKDNPDAKVIAVDPDVIPLHSLVHVEGYGYAIAGDTGSAIRGNKIDVFLSSEKAAKNWGVRKVKVTIQ